MAVDVAMNLHARAGNDRLTARGIRNPEAPAGANPLGAISTVRAALTMEGGAGNDVLDAVFQGLATEPGELDAVLLGGMGDDTLRLLWTEQAWPGAGLRGRRPGATAACSPRRGA